MLSEKYIAGFLDSDGSIQIYWRKVDRADSNPSLKRAYLGLEFSQLTKQDEVLYRIQESLGGKIEHLNRCKCESSRLRIFGKKAVIALNRIRKHLIVKRHYANVALDMANKVFNRKKAAIYLKEQRKVRSLPLPNFPPRKWLAGFFDGDGCVQIRVPKKRNAAQVVAEITSSDFDMESIEIIHKAFGGSYQMSSPNPRGKIASYTLTVPPSKAEKFFGYFVKHSINKKEQIYFILGCAKMGHYRDGKSIKAIVKQLKAQPHRLSEPRQDVSELLKTVKDISLADTYKGRNFWFEGRSKAHLVKR